MAKTGAASIAEWLEALVEEPTLAGSATAIRAAGEIVDTDDRKLPIVQRARIVLNHDGKLVQPVSGTLFLPLEDADLKGDFNVVHRQLAELSCVRESLSLLAIQELDSSSELQDLLVRRGRTKFETSDWERFWQLTRKVDVDRAKQLIEAHLRTDLAVKT
ncbi:MAG: hypothetical protein IIA66_02305, partial [Planctomycetes bacterium]|nr:hypothetical protein [Planctomycetota bacterium]